MELLEGSGRPVELMVNEMAVAPPPVTCREVPTSTELPVKVTFPTEEELMTIVNKYVPGIFMLMPMLPPVVITFASDI